MASYKMQEALKPVLVLEETGVTTATSDEATRRVKLGEARQCLFVVMLEAAADANFREGQDVGLRLRQATAVTGGTVANLGDQHIVEGAQNANLAFVDVSDAADGDITVNGIEFAYGTQTTANWTNWENATELETALNAAFPNFTIVRSTNVITIASTDPDAETISIVEDVTAAGTYAGTRRCAAMLEVSRAQMDDDKDYVFVEVDNDMSNQTTGTVNATVLAVLGAPYRKPMRQVVALQE